MIGIACLATSLFLAPAAMPAPSFFQDKPAVGDEVAVLETSKGQVVLMFFPAVAPKHVENFKSLAKEGFYDGTRFHRCIANFMIQGGDPNSKDLSQSSSWGTGGKLNADGSRRTVNAEFNDTKHRRGVLSMARSSDPNSGGSQFFIMVADAPHLDRQYSAFGQVVSGMEVVDQIVLTGDSKANGRVAPEAAIVLKSVKIVKWPIEKGGN